MSLPPSTLLPQLVTDLTAFRQALSVMLEHTAGTTPSRTAQVVSGSKASYCHFWVFSSMACAGLCVRVRAHDSLIRPSCACSFLPPSSWLAGGMPPSFCVYACAHAHSCVCSCVCGLCGGCVVKSPCFLGSCWMAPRDGRPSLDDCADSLLDGPA